MNRNDFLPFGIRKVFHGMHDLYASVCNQDIDTAKLFNGLIDTRIHSGFICHVHHDAHGLAACFNDLGRDSVCSGLIQIRNHNRCTFLCEGEGGLAADTAGSTSD